MFTSEQYLTRLHNDRPVVSTDYRDFFTVKSFTAATLDKDDVMVARQWLLRRDSWNDQETVKRYESFFASIKGIHQERTLLRVTDNQGVWVDSCCYHIRDFKISIKS